MKNRIFIAVTAIIMAAAFLLPQTQAAGPQGTGGGHAHGPHTNPQGKTVGNGDPSFNQSWWTHYNANQTQVMDWGGVTTSGDWPANTVQWVGTLTLIDQTSNNPSWQQSQTTYDNTGPDLTSPWEALNAGDTYKLEWHMVGTLLQPGWTWGWTGTTACYISGSQMICDYTTNQILIPLMATPTPQATNTPAPTATPSNLTCNMGLQLTSEGGGMVAYVVPISVTGANIASIRGTLEWSNLFNSSQTDEIALSADFPAGSAIQVATLSGTVTPGSGIWEFEAGATITMWDGRVCDESAVPIMQAV